MMKYSSLMLFNSENQQFLKDIISSVLDGQGVGWLKVSRVKKLMEDENYRNFVVSRLNTSLDKKLAEEDTHCEDVVCDSSPPPGQPRLHIPVNF